jgi:glycosyltransferase involved in cell wall biosynthesis
VILVERRLTHYRVPLFERMRQLLTARQIGFELLVGTGTPEEAAKRDDGHVPWAKAVPTRYFLSGSLCWQSLGGPLRKADLVVVNHQNKLLYNHWLLWAPRRCRLGLWGHGRNLQARSSGTAGEQFKQWAMSRADWYFAYTQLTVDTVVQAGFPAARVTNLNNTIDTARLGRERRAISPEDVAVRRRELGLNGAPVGAFVGSLHAAKRLDFLIEACRQIRQRVPGFQCLIIGDGAERAKVERWSAAHNWVHWVGARHGREKALYLACAAVILNPGMVGLGIMDSFVCGVPLITTDCGIHSPEIAYLRPGENGVMTRDNVADFATRTAELLDDPAARERMGRACLASAGEYSLEGMASRFVEGMVQALQATRKR